MKKVISSLAFAAVITFGFASFSNAQVEGEPDQNVAELLDEEGNPIEAEPVEEVAGPTAGDAKDGANNATGEDDKKKELTFVQELKKQFIDGSPLWMTLPLICLIIGLALSIERIIYLNLSTINTKKFLEDVETALKNGGVDAAKDVCRNTRGPIASIYYQGLDRTNEGIEMVEKSVVSYGGVQMGLMEKGLSWLSLFIALAPMLGFLGTVIGMIFAFDKIIEDGQVSPTTVAGGIKVSLLTTVFGLIAAIILQIFYNYIVSKIDGIVNEMEDASISLVDMMLKHKIAKV